MIKLEKKYKLEKMREKKKQTNKKNLNLDWFSKLKTYKVLDPNSIKKDDELKKKTYKLFKIKQIIKKNTSILKKTNWNVTLRFCKGMCKNREWEREKKATNAKLEIHWPHTSPRGVPENI